MIFFHLTLRVFCLLILSLFLIVSIHSVSSYLFDFLFYWIIHCDCTFGDNWSLCHNSVKKASKRYTLQNGISTQCDVIEADLVTNFIAKEVTKWMVFGNIVIIRNIPDTPAPLNSVRYSILKAASLLDSSCQYIRCTNNA